MGACACACVCRCRYECECVRVLFSSFEVAKAMKIVCDRRICNLFADVVASTILCSAPNLEFLTSPFHTKVSCLFLCSCLVALKRHMYFTAHA